MLCGLRTKCVSLLVIIVVIFNINNIIVIIVTFDIDNITIIVIIVVISCYIKFSRLRKIFICKTNRLLEKQNTLGSFWEEGNDRLIERRLLLVIIIEVLCSLDWFTNEKSHFF